MYPFDYYLDDPSPAPSDPSYGQSYAPPSKDVTVHVVIEKPDATAAASSGPLAQVEAPSAAVPPAEEPGTLLVFKDGRQVEIKNYAIQGDTLFDLSDGRPHKIALADLDLDATQKKNDDRGVDFQLPLRGAGN
jgi:hypothetical protein